MTSFSLCSAGNFVYLSIITIVKYLQQPAGSRSNLLIIENYYYYVKYLQQKGKFVKEVREHLGHTDKCSDSAHLPFCNYQFLSIMITFNASMKSLNNTFSSLLVSVTGANYKGYYIF